MEKNIIIRAVYAGTFDPPTKGHIDIIERASKQFDNLIVVIMQNPEKGEGFLTLEQRESALKELFGSYGNVTIRSEIKEKLLVDFCRHNNSTVMIRGLRAISDFDHEFKLSLANRTIAPDIETFFIMSDARYSFISSSLLKDMAKLGAEISELVPLNVANLVKETLEIEK